MLSVRPSSSNLSAIFVYSVRLKKSNRQFRLLCPPFSSNILERYCVLLRFSFFHSSIFSKSFRIGIPQIITSNSKQIYIFEDPKLVENKSKSLHNWFALCCYNYVSSTIYVSCIMLKFVVYIKYQVDRLITIVTRMYQVQLCIFLYHVRL